MYARIAFPYCSLFNQWQPLQAGSWASLPMLADFPGFSAFCSDKRFRPPLTLCGSSYGASHYCQEALDPTMRKWCLATTVWESGCSLLSGWSLFLSYWQWKELEKYLFKEKNTSRSSDSSTSGAQASFTHTGVLLFPFSNMERPSSQPHQHNHAFALSHTHTPTVTPLCASLCVYLK